jgi:hypothetical protein
VGREKTMIKPVHTRLLNPFKAWFTGVTGQRQRERDSHTENKKGKKKVTQVRIFIKFK